MIIKLREENGFSLLELSVAVGIAALVATTGIAATTTFINDSGEKKENYIQNADESIINVEDKYLNLTNPLMGFMYDSSEVGYISFNPSETGQTIYPLGADFEGSTFEIIDGQLPEGVTFNTSTGAITGPDDWGYAAIGNGTSGVDRTHGVATTSDKATIITGGFENTMSLGAQTLASAGGTDIFVAKISHTGSYDWVFKAGGTGEDYGYDVATDSDDNVYITGGFSSTATFSDETVTSNGGTDVFVAKLNPEGALQWVTTGGGNGSEHGSTITSTSNSIMVAGSYTGAVAFGEITLTSSGEADMFTVKLSQSGSIEWATSDGTSKTETVNDVQTTTTGETIIVGTASYKPEAQVDLIAVEVDDATRPITELTETGQYYQKTVLNMDDPTYETLDRRVKETRSEPYQESYTYGCGYKYRGTCTGYRTKYRNVDYYDYEPVQVVSGYNTHEVDDTTRPIMEATPTGEYEQKTMYKACVGEGEEQQCSGLLSQEETYQEVTLNGETIRVTSEQVDDLNNPIMTTAPSGQYEKKPADDTSQPVYRDELIWEYESYTYNWQQKIDYRCGYKNRGWCHRYEPRSETRWHWVQNPLQTLIGYEQKMVDDTARPVMTEVASDEYNQTPQYSLSEDKDLIVVKFDSNGQKIWESRIGDSGEEAATTVKTLNDGSVIISGTFTNTATFGSETVTSNGEADVFVAKLNSNGDVQWVTTGGSTGKDVVTNSISIGSDIIISGAFTNTATFGSETVTSDGAADVFVAKLNSNGDVQWVTTGGSSGEDTVNSLDSMADGSIMIAGSFENTATFGNHTVTSNGGEDSYVAKINPDGDWAPLPLTRSTETISVEASDGTNTAVFDVTISTN